jgi:hypothetical protein
MHRHPVWAAGQAAAGEFRSCLLTVDVERFLQPRLFTCELLTGRMPGGRAAQGISRPNTVVGLDLMWEAL